jgi:hypothetical protein
MIEDSNSSDALDVPVKDFTMSNGNYYILYENCKEELKLKFIKKIMANQFFKERCCC